MRLSEQRANSVARYLASQGVPADRIRAEGRGETQLKVTPEECAAQGAKTRPALIQCYQPNRRVDVTVNAAASGAGKAWTLGCLARQGPRSAKTNERSWGVLLIY